MKKLLGWSAAVAAAAIVLVALVCGVASVRWHPSRREGRPRLEEVAVGSGPLLAGAAAVPLSPPAKVPVAGFPRLRWAAEGWRDPMAVRALALREPGCTVVLVSAEILLVPGELQTAIERKVDDLGIDRLIVAATHTHAGPGGYWNEPLGERLATGPYDAALLDDLIARSASAVRQAVAALAPASLSVGRGEAADLARNRNGGPVDGRLISFDLTSPAGAPMARVVLFPAHATLLGGENRLLSGDWPGALMRAAPEPVLFFQGAVGDQTPVRPPGASGPEAYARALWGRVAALRPGPPDPRPRLAVAVGTTVLPPPVPGAAPKALRHVLADLFYGLVPERAEVSAVQLGPLRLVAVPGEPVAEVGRRWREAAGEGAEILSLADDYVGYVETRERMAQTSGETERTYYGPELAERLRVAVKLAADAVQNPAAAGVEPRDQNRTTARPVRSSLER
jgi:hypothetical protein